MGEGGGMQGRACSSRHLVVYLRIDVLQIQVHGCVRGVQRTLDPGASACVKDTGTQHACSQEQAVARCGIGHVGAHLTRAEQTAFFCVHERAADNGRAHLLLVCC